MSIRDLTRELIRGDEKALVASDYTGSKPNLYGTQGAPRRRLSHPNASRHLKAYAGSEDAIDWVMDYASLIATTAAQAPYHFTRDEQKLVPGSTKGQPKGVSRAPADLTNLLAYPNPYTTREELFELLCIDFLLVGDAYWLKFGRDDAGKPKAIWRLQPDLVSIEVNERGFLDHYTYTVPGSKAVEYGPEEVLHFRRPNPHDPFYGAGIIAGAPRMYDLELFLTESQTGYYDRGTRLSGVLETDKNVSPALFQKIKATFAELYAGRDNAHSVAVLERGLTYKATESTSRDAQYIEASKFSRDRIALAFGIDPTLLDSSGAVGPAAREAQRKFDTKTMKPFLNKLQGAISTGLTQAWGLDFEFEFEYLPPREDQLQLAGGVAALPGITIREVREAAGFPPLGKPEIDDIVLNLPGADNNASNVKDRNLTGEAGRPPNPENTRAINDSSVNSPDARVRLQGKGFSAEALREAMDDLEAHFNG